MHRLKIATFNVNGIGARLANLLDWLEKAQPDIVCLQELKAPDKAFPTAQLEAAGYGSLHHGQASWNGVAILSRDSQPLEIRRHLPGEEDDPQARYLEAAVHGIVVACLYLPNGNPQPGPRFDYKLRWFNHLLEHAQALVHSEHPALLAGDFNVVPTDFDIYNTRSWLKDALLQPESRERFATLLAQGWTDAIRHLHPQERLYTFWDYWRQHWQNNSGLRIDHLLLNPVLVNDLQDAGVDAWVRGEEQASDHAPAWIRLGDDRAKGHDQHGKMQVPRVTQTSASPLTEYNRKRNFTATPEPSGEPVAPQHEAGDLRFCIQKHDASRLHYDFRLELGGTLKSWAVPKGPSLDPKNKRLAIHVEDHPLSYADFEGTIPEGHYGAGQVIVWDRGHWIPLGDPDEAYTRGRLKFELQGDKLSGIWNLVRTQIEGKRQQWFLIKHRDDSARPESDYDITAERPDSVLSDRVLTPEIPKKRDKTAIPRPARKSPAVRQPAARLPHEGGQPCALPPMLKPQLATLVNAPPAGEWRYELKLDGYRILARVENGQVRLFTRSGNDWTHKLPRQAQAIASLGLESAWLDGEMVVVNEQGIPDFQALQNAFEADQSGRIVYYLFDLPYLNGMDLRQVALEQRRAALTQVLDKTEDEVLRFSADFAQAPEALLDSACQLQMEGLVGKRAGSFYLSRRSDDWIKLKCKLRQEFVVVGYTDPKGTRSRFGALLLGLHDATSGALKYAGKVGTGFNLQSLTTVHEQLMPLALEKAPVINPPTGVEARGVHWVEPVLLAEVAYTQMTQDGVVRHAVFHGLRSDRPARSITRERPAQTVPVKDKGFEKDAGSGPGKIRLTHPDRVIDPVTGATKRDLADYYIRVADWILPHLAHRPVALVRAPDGIGADHFFQKNAQHLAIAGLEILDKKQTGQPVMVINSAQALIGSVQMNMIELHTWNAVSPTLDTPDRFILDLDPDPALPWKMVIEATQLTLTVLDELGLTSFIKTSGGKGIHVLVPLTPEADWASVKAFSQALVRHMARLVPERFTAVAGPRNRVGRIFIDYLRNGMGATTATAYTARAREGLAVSVPIFRDELAHIEGADAWTIHDVSDRLARLPSDPWARLSSTRQTITAQMRRRLGMK